MRRLGVVFALAISIAVPVADADMESGAAGSTEATAPVAWKANGCGHGHGRKSAKRGVRTVMRSSRPLTKKRGRHAWHFVKCVHTVRLERDMRHYVVIYRHWRRVHLCGTGGTVSQNVRLGRCEAAKRGWTGSQWSCLYTLWNHESGWVTTKANYAGSGAYGIPQALPGSKMGPGWQTNPVVQVRWGLGYIAGRYGSPCGAWGYWLGANSY